VEEQSDDRAIQYKMSSFLVKNQEPKLYVRVLHINFLLLLVQNKINKKINVKLT